MTDKNLGNLYRAAVSYVEHNLAPRCKVIMSEVAISINWAEGKAEILPEVKDRKYPNRPGWQNGTADVVCILEDGTLLVGDWKTGGTDGVTEQLLSLACGFRKALMDEDPNGQPIERKVRISCLHVTEEGVDPEETSVSPERLDNHWFSMEMAWADKDKANEPVPGIHCTQLFCPHLAYCSAVSSVVTEGAAEDGKAPIGGQELIPASRLLGRGLSMTEKPLSDEDAGYTMARVTAARRQMKYYETAMKKYIESGGRVISGSYEWRETNAGFRWGRLRQ